MERRMKTEKCFDVESQSNNVCECNDILVIETRKYCPDSQEKFNFIRLEKMLWIASDIVRKKKYCFFFCFFCSDILINVSSVGWNYNLNVCVLFMFMLIVSFVHIWGLLEYVYFVALYTSSNGIKCIESLFFSVLFSPSLSYVSTVFFLYFPL